MCSQPLDNGGVPPTSEVRFRDTPLSWPSMPRSRYKTSILMCELSRYEESDLEDDEGEEDEEEEAGEEGDAGEEEDEEPAGKSDMHPRAVSRLTVNRTTNQETQGRG